MAGLKQSLKNQKVKFEKFRQTFLKSCPYGIKNGMPTATPIGSSFCMCGCAFGEKREYHGTYIHADKIKCYYKNSGWFKKKLYENKN